MNIPVRWAYPAVFIGVCGHASSEFFAKLTGVAGPEVSVWRYVIGAIGLLIWSLSRPDSRDLLTPLREDWRGLIPLSLLGVSAAYLFFHWALDFASVIQVATLVTTIPIFAGLANLAVNRTPISTVKIVTGTLAVVGIAILLTDGYLEVLSEGSSLQAVLMAIMCAALAAGYSVLAKPMMQRHGGMRITTLAITIGAGGLWLLVGALWGYLGESVDALLNAGGRILVTDCAWHLEHDYHPVALVRRPGLSAGHDARFLPLFPQARDCRHSRDRYFG